jgi:hypothetical protein
VGGSLPATTMNIMWRVTVGQYDSMDTAHASERNQYPSQGQLWYVPANNISGTNSIYRERRPQPPQDHMMSWVYGEGGYTVDGTMAFGYSSAQPGTLQLLRYRNPSNSDHATLQPGETMPGYNLDANMPFWGYPRFWNMRTDLLAISAGGVTMQLNKVMGGVLWNWTDSGGFNYVDTNDQGREIQGAFFVSNQNPTEAGDGASGALAAQDQHGSPTTYFNYSGSFFTSRTIPLDFNPALFGVTSDQTLAYTQMSLGHDITLDYGGLGAVAKYTSWLTLPNSEDGASYEIPTSYLNASLSTLYSYDAGSDALLGVSIEPSSCAGSGSQVSYQPPSGYGGVIAATADGQHAFGQYGLLTSVGGPLGYLALWNLLDCPAPVIKTDAVATGTFAAGTSSFNTYIMSGSLSSVRQLMRQLYLSKAA